MNKLRISTAVTTVLTGLSVIALFAMYLALSDIAHGAEDLTLEWRIVQLSYATCWLMTLSVLVMLILRAGSEKKG